MSVLPKFADDIILSFDIYIISARSFCNTGRRSRLFRYNICCDSAEAWEFFGSERIDMRYVQVVFK